MTTYTWSATTLGTNVDWNTPADWQPEEVPDSATTADVVLPMIAAENGIPYDFLVTIGSAQSYVIHSLTLEDQTLVLDGTLSVAAGLTVDEGGAVEIAGSLALGSLVNPNGGAVEGSGQISSAGSIDNQGAISGDNLTLDFATLQNDGTLIASQGVLDVNVAAGGFTNLVGGTLAFGTFEASGVLDLNVGGDITTDAASIVLQNALSGAPGTIETTGTDGSAHPLTQTLQTIASTGVLTLDATFAGSQSLTVAGTLQLGGGSLSAPAVTVTAGGAILGTGTIAGPILDDGTIDVGEQSGNAGTATGVPALVLDGPVTGTGVIVIPPPGTDTIDNGPLPASTLDLAGPAANAVDVGGLGGVLVLGDPTQFSGEIAGFAAGVSVYDAKFFFPTSDTIVLSGLPAGTVTDESYTGTSASGTLSFDAGGTSVSLGFVGDYVLSDFVFGGAPQVLSTLPSDTEITESLPCFLAGTRLLTDRGEVPVERLAVGDRLRTPASGGHAAIRWIGHRRIDARRHARPEQVWPVRVRADAFGLGRPARDLMLSPDHAIFVDGVLIPARCLVNGTTIVQAPVSVASYFHVELARHDVVLAEGLPAETYLDLGNRGAFANGGGAVALHPDFARRIWGRTACAEQILGGPVLERVRARLAVQAELLGLPRAAECRLPALTGTRC